VQCKRAPFQATPRTAIEPPIAPPVRDGPTRKTKVNLKSLLATPLDLKDYQEYVSIVHQNLLPKRAAGPPKFSGSYSRINLRTSIITYRITAAGTKNLLDHSEISRWRLDPSTSRPCPDIPKGSPIISVHPRYLYDLKPSTTSSRSAVVASHTRDAPPPP
jgi:hypothetical protein